MIDGLKRHGAYQPSLRDDYVKLSIPFFAERSGGEMVELQRIPDALGNESGDHTDVNGKSVVGEQAAKFGTISE